MRFSRYEYGGTFILMIAMDARDYQEGVRACPPDALPQLDQIRLEEGNYDRFREFAAKWNVKEGDLSIHTRENVDLKVIGSGVTIPEPGHDLHGSKATRNVRRPAWMPITSFLLDAATTRRTKQFTPTPTEVAARAESGIVHLPGRHARQDFQIAYLQQMIVAIVAALGVMALAGLVPASPGTRHCGRRGVANPEDRDRRSYIDGCSNHSRFPIEY